MLKARVNEGKEFDLIIENKTIQLNGQEQPVDIAQIDERNIHLLHGFSSLRAEVLKADFREKVFQLRINNRQYKVTLADKTDLLLQRLGMNSANSKKANVLKAPMPGLVVSVNVTAGQTVEQGEPLLVLEAMKMENILKAPAGATVKEVKVSAGATVEKNQVLITFS